MDFYISLPFIAAAAILSALICLPVLKIIQLSGYKARGVFAWWKDTHFDLPVRYSALMLFGAISIGIFVACFATFARIGYLAVALYDVFAVVFVVSSARSGANAAKFTGRMVRLFAVTAVIMLALGAGVAALTYLSVYCQILAAVLALFAPFVALAANAVTAPFEKLNNKKYVKRAKAKLAEKSPIIIGITGSYGKTTAKNLLNAMLAEKYTVLATPGSYNTPMGVCKTVNNMLGEESVLIVEMGARYKGDIKELCDIVMPQYGIITAVGDMHLETLGDRDGVAAVKFELGQALPKNGLLVLNGYNADCMALENRQTECAVTVTGGSAAAYENLVIGRDGTSFELVKETDRVSVKTKLLGAHIAELVCVCAAVATALGVDLEDIARAVATMKPVEHRLELLDNGSSAVTVIDDAFNSNPIGAKNALDVLSCFDGSRIIITPGFVELGALEKPSNTELGRQLGAVCDYAFLVGSRAADIKKGAVASGMSEERIFLCASRDEAVEQLKNIDGEKTVLFENDLPDNIK